MEEKLIHEYYRLINIYRHTKSKVTKESIKQTLRGIYYICGEYGIKIPKVSNYIIGYDESTDQLYDFDTDSLDYIKKLADKIVIKLGVADYETYKIYDVINAKVNKDKYDKIIIDYLKQYRPNLYDLYMKMLKENRIFEIETGYDSADCNFFTIPFSHDNSSIAVVDCYATLSYYFGIVHELSHVDCDENNKYYGKLAQADLANNLDEVYPIYNEIILGEYFKTNKLTDKNYAFELAKNQLIYNDNSLLDDFDIHFMGNVLAISFYEMYLENKEKAEYNIKEFLKKYKGNDFKTNLNSFGLNEHKILSLKAIER